MAHYESEHGGSMLVKALEEMRYLEGKVKDYKEVIDRLQAEIARLNKQLDEYRKYSQIYKSVEGVSSKIYHDRLKMAHFKPAFKKSASCERVKELIDQDISDCDVIAAKLGVSAATIRRRMKSLGTSPKDIRAAVAERERQEEEYIKSIRLTGLLTKNW